MATGGIMIVEAEFNACECCYVMLETGEPCEHPRCHGLLLSLAPTGGNLHSVGDDPCTITTGCELCGQGQGLQMSAYLVIKLASE